MRQLSQRAQTEHPIEVADPGDEVLIQTLIDAGMDRREAGAWRFLHTGTSGRITIRRSALQFYADTKAAARGNAAARDRVDFLKDVYRAMTLAQRERDAEAADAAAMSLEAYVDADTARKLSAAQIVRGTV